MKNTICHRKIKKNSSWCDLQLSDYLATGYAFTNIYAGGGTFPNNNLHLLSFHGTTGIADTYI